MSNLINKENISIVIGTYEKDGQQRNSYRTVGELITMQGENGPYQFGKFWGPGGVCEFKVFSQDSKSAPPQQQHQGGQQNYQQPQQQYQQPQQQYQQQGY